jgi:hypothetical protein
MTGAELVTLFGEQKKDSLAVGVVTVAVIAGVVLLFTTPMGKQIVNKVKSTLKLKG